MIVMGSNIAQEDAHLHSQQASGSYVLDAR